jgi:hypothetical protein
VTPELVGYRFYKFMQRNQIQNASPGRRAAGASTTRETLGQINLKEVREAIDYQLGNCAGPKSPPPPAQTPLEFANASLVKANQINSGLGDLRRRIFGDESEPDPEPKIMPCLESVLAATHFALATALEQIEAIHGRL